MGERLFFARLVLTGPGRNYEVRFHDGVNLICGPIWTGKSSILQLLDYACGARNAPTYPEISKCSDLYVECVAGGETLTIRRSLKSATARAMLYEGGIDQVFDQVVVGAELSARHSREAMSVSTEVMQRLGLAGIDVKTAPTQQASDLSAFSIRDLLMLIYIDQDRMGSARGFFEAEPHKHIKWRAAFEIVHDLFDGTAARLASSLKEAEAEEQRIRAYLQNARFFLDGSKIPPIEDLERQFIETESREKDLVARIRVLRNAARHGLGDNLELVNRRGALDEERTAVSARITELKRSLVQLGRLRVQYERERAQLEFLNESEALVGGLPVVRCPACLQAVDPEPDRATCYLCNRSLPNKTVEITAEARLRSIRRRISDLDGYVGELQTEVEKLEEQRACIVGELGQIDQALHRLR